MSTAKKTTRKATAKRPTTAGKSAAKKGAARKRATTKRATTKRATTKRATTKRATTKRAAKKTVAKRSAAKKTGARKTTARKAPARKTTARKTTARKSPAKKAPARTSAAKAAGPYTKPELRERLKARILRGDKGGKAGQWSARKAQLLAHAYESEGGGYKGGKSSTQRHLQEWTQEAWTTSDGKRARRGSGTTRYLPEKAWSKLSASEKAATNRKKVEGSRRGRQHVANTTRATRARRAATTHR